MIIEEIDESLFISRFEDYKRVGKDKNFSYAGLRALFQYLEDTTTEENPLNLDVISLCCGFNEYSNLKEYLKDYSNQHTTEEEIRNDNNIKDEEEFNEIFKDKIEEEINNKTILIKIGNDLDEGFIIQAY